MSVQTDKSRSTILDNLKEGINEFKQDLILNLDENSESLAKIMPLFHIMIYMVLNF